MIVGHSLGGFTALLAEIRHPGAFSALCLLSPGPADPALDPVGALDFLIAHGHDRDMLREGVGAMFARAPGATLDLMLDAITLIDRSVFRALQAENARTSISGRLQDIGAPLLLLCGERDTVVTPSRQHEIARRVKHCKEVVYSTGGHMLPNEEPALVAREIIAFLDDDRAVMARSG